MTLTRKARQAWKAEAKNWDGYRYATFARSTGTLVVVVDGRVAGLESDPDAPRWFTVCDDHDTLVGHYTLADAKSHAAGPEGWCEQCASIYFGDEQ